MVLVEGSSMATYFPLQGEEPSSFASDITGYLNREDGWWCFEEEDTMKIKE